MRFPNRIALYRGNNCYAIVEVGGPLTPGGWTAGNTTAENYTLHNVTWAPEAAIFCAVGPMYLGVGSCATSTDGQTWTRRTYINRNSYRVRWNGSYFVSSTSDGAYSGKSSDGITWNEYTPGSKAWRGLAYGNSKWVMFDLDGTATDNLNTSSDGQTWSAATVSPNNRWCDVVWNGSLFVAVALTGTGNRVLTSPDGTTWTARTSAADNDWWGVAWSAELGLFVAVASTGSGNRVMTSPDGITWTARTSAADNSWRYVAWGAEAGYFSAVSSTGTSNRIMVSSDGINWTTQDTSVDDTLFFFGIAYSPSLKRFVTVNAVTTGIRSASNTYS